MTYKNKIFSKSITRSVIFSFFSTHGPSGYLPLADPQWSQDRRLRNPEINHASVCSCIQEITTRLAACASRIDQVRQMFREFDADGSGSVSVAEVKPMLHKLGLKDEEIERLVAQHDANHDGELQYDEFVSFLWHN